MKKIIALLLIISLLSCSKQKDGPCYICTFGVSPNGTQSPPEEMCGQDPNAYIANHKDAQGNSTGGSCQLK